MPVSPTIDRGAHNMPLEGGYTVEHATKRNAFEVIIDFNRPYKDNWSFVCPTCNQRHFHKAYHILLNEHGRAVLSPQVYRGIKEAGMGDLVLLGHTRTPPNQVLGTKGGMMGLVPVRDKTTIYHK